MQGGNRLAHEFFDLDQSDSYFAPDKLAGIIETTPTRANHVSLAVVLGAIVGSTSVNTWRHPHATAAAYFTQLAAWGYPLSDVEQIVLDTHTDHPQTIDAVEAETDGPAGDEDDVIDE
ncbi:hypothetical protein NY547_13230 [Cnuibacter physcomitrellae]|uniref:hypothetical protein n=1 Tax=Cnuibacter physcomitrellae TaxID=1619308 RepID=UPI002175F6FD|nr:hypothetical protein [Cnuibacter physcomitrellae]MCS5498206.1 hypothetical protein [Cnuibacter physcomitrellae]